MAGIKRQIKLTTKKVQEEIAMNSGSFYGAGLATEGYAGGYLQALSDVTLALNGVDPGGRYWQSIPNERQTND